MTISSVTSEALQLKLRQLLPSQQGFGTDLSASDTIIPIIDLTEAAEGSDVPEFLQRSWTFETGHLRKATTGTTTFINTTGFWQIGLTASLNFGLASAFALVGMSDGATTNTIWRFDNNGAQGNDTNSLVQDTFTVFLDAGKSVFAQVSDTNNPLNLWYRQVADINGTLVNPVGFSPS